MGARLSSFLFTLNLFFDSYFKYHLNTRKLLTMYYCMICRSTCSRCTRSWRASSTSTYTARASARTSTSRSPCSSSTARRSSPCSTTPSSSRHTSGQSSTTGINRQVELIFRKRWLIVDILCAECSARTQTKTWWLPKVCGVCFTLVTNCPWITTLRDPRHVSWWVGNYTLKIFA